MFLFCGLETASTFSMIGLMKFLTRKQFDLLLTERELHKAGATIVTMNIGDFFKVGESGYVIKTGKEIHINSTPNKEVSKCVL